MLKCDTPLVVVGGGGSFGSTMSHYYCSLWSIQETKPSLGIKLSIKVEKYPVLLYNCSHQITRFSVFWNFWKNPMVLWNFWNTQNWQFFESGFFFSCTRSWWFFDSENFQIPKTHGSLILIFKKYPEPNEYSKIQILAPKLSIS
jgi:hypothetical protein